MVENVRMNEQLPSFASSVCNNGLVMLERFKLPHGYTVTLFAKAKRSRSLAKVSSTRVCAQLSRS